jgi:hypothetical protein
MPTFTAIRPPLTPTYNRSDLAAVSVVGAVVGAWAACCAGSFSLLALLACEAAFLAFYLVGSLLASWRSLAAGIHFDLPLRLLAGYTAVNTALFALAWFSPLGIIANFGVIVAGAMALFMARRPVREQGPKELAGLWVLIISLAATTLWCQDSLTALESHGFGLGIKPWADGFYHAVHIRIFGNAHGATSIEDFRLAGVPARLYHYAPYLTPALIRQASGIPSYTAFAGILSPMGVFFTGLAAYALVSSFWGSWPGFAACVALLLLPDGPQQGTQNPFMSYHCLTQISPGATYGIAVLALAWLFVLRGCTRGSLLQVFVGWLVGACAIFYKAQFFIASALPLLLTPPVFLRGKLKPRHRAAWAAAAIACYITAISASQDRPGFPLIRLDGSSTEWILNLINALAPVGPLKGFVYEHLGVGKTWLANLVLGAPYLLLVSLGAFLPLLMVLAVLLRKRIAPVVLLFPLALMGNFLAMTLGLAKDDRGIGTPEEFLHRPFMIMYFVVVTWAGGAVGYWLTKVRALRRIAPLALVVVPVALMVVPASLGRGVQRLFPSSDPYNVRVAMGLYRCIEFIHTHAKPTELFQDSSFDSNYMVAALSESRPFVEHMMVHVSQNAQAVADRTALVTNFTQRTDPATVAATARSLWITWYLLRPGDHVAWPPSIANSPAFEYDGYKVYRFD